MRTNRPVTVPLLEKKSLRRVCARPTLPTTFAAGIVAIPASARPRTPAASTSRSKLSTSPWGRARNAITRFTTARTPI